MIICSAMPFRQTKTLLERFESFFKKVDDCWLWRGTKTAQGYGHFSCGRKHRPIVMKAHRQSWLLYRGPIPDGMCALHSCDTPSCVNPSHLFLGSNAVNIADRNAKGRQARGESHPAAKIDAITVRTIRDCGAASDELAAAYGLTVRSINQIRSRETWRHVP